MVGFGGIVAQNGNKWYGSYSSDDYESDPQAGDEKIYYQWQLESLRKSVSPRFINLMNMENYLESGRLLSRGLLFTYNGLHNSSVEVCGNFTSWNCVEMKRNRFGVYYSLVDIGSFGKMNKFDYKFRVDGFYELDPENTSTTSDGEGALMSRYHFYDLPPDKQITVKTNSNEVYGKSDLRKVEFSVYLPDADVVSIVGNFNHWDSEMDYLKKEKNGIFRLQKRLLPGDYFYYYVVDGKYMLDVYNPDARILSDTEEKVSFLKVK